MSGHQGLGDRGSLNPAEADCGLRLGVGTPQGVVLGEDPGGNAVLDEGGKVLFECLLRGTGGVVAESAHGWLGSLPCSGEGAFDVGQQFLPAGHELVQAL